MTKKHMGFHWHLPQQVEAQNSQARTAVKDQAFFAQAHFYTGGVPSVAKCFGAGGGYVAPHAPKLNDKLGQRTIFHCGFAIGRLWIG
jgi:hypothetical protein